MKITSSLLFSLFIVVPGMAAAQSNHQQEAQAINEAKVTLAQAVQTAESETGAKAVEVDFDRENNVWSYEVTTLKPGTKYELVIDANTGKVISRKEEQKQ
ncbi:PepSY domain-containing protein [Advenella kashmirensis]